MLQRKRGYQLLVANHPDEALRISEAHSGEIGLLIADQYFPGEMTGSEVGARMRQRYPDMPVLFVSGTPMEFWPEPDQAELRGLPEGSFHFMQKPFQAQTLLTEVDRLTKRRRALAASG
jgi:DNA-binding NtrC family response regulator